MEITGITAGIITANEARSLRSANVDETKQKDEELYKKQLNAHIEGLCIFLSENITEAAKKGKVGFSTSASTHNNICNFKRDAKTIAETLHSRFINAGYQTVVYYDGQYIQIVIYWG